MYNHVPAEYVCPICLGVAGVENNQTLLLRQDLVAETDEVAVFVNSFFIGKNPGHVIVVPKQHYEHIYDLSDTVMRSVLLMAQKVAQAMKHAYMCDGVMLLQNNEPASGQHAFHFHLHVFPRYEDDGIFRYLKEKRLAQPAERLEYAQKLRGALG